MYETEKKKWAMIRDKTTGKLVIMDIFRVVSVEDSGNGVITITLDEGTSIEMNYLVQAFWDEVISRA